ncbi:MAG TPA: copper chaperone PCu(A)C [Casimicrobiaceae bacterium]
MHARTRVAAATAALLASIAPLPAAPVVGTLAAIVAAVAAPPAHGADYSVKDLRIGHPYARPTPPGARTGGAYFAIENLGKEPDRLLRLASPAAGAVELHSMTMQGNVMRMRSVAALDVPAGRKVTLGPSGYHAMLLDLKRPLAVGDKVPLTLTFEKAGSIDIEVPVEAPKDGAADDTTQRH